MDKKITVKRRSTSETESGGIKEVGDPTTVFTDWAYIKSVNGNKWINYTQMGYTNPKEIYISNRNKKVMPTDFVDIDGESHEMILPPYITEDNKFIVMEVSR